MKIGDEVMIHGFVDELRKDIIIIKNDGGYFGTIYSEVVEIDQNEYLTLDEAILHAEQVADRCSLTDGNILCEMEHRQLAKWLKELKVLRSKLELIEKGEQNQEEVV